MLPEPLDPFTHFILFSSVLPDHCLHPLKIKDLDRPFSLVFFFHIYILQKRDPVIIPYQALSVDRPVVQTPAAFQRFFDISVFLVPADRFPAHFRRNIHIQRHAQGQAVHASSSCPGPRPWLLS